MTFTLYCRITRTLLLNRSVAKPETLDISTQTSRAIRFPAQSQGFSFDDFSYVVAVVLERVWAKKPRKEKTSQAMSRCQGFGDLQLCFVHKQSARNSAIQCKQTKEFCKGNHSYTTMNNYADYLVCF